MAFKTVQFRRHLLSWYRRHGRDLPWRRTRDPYAVLVSELMLQQTQVVTVVRYYHQWLLRFPDFATLASASENDVLRAWQGLGYYARARNLHRTARIIVERCHGRFPRSIEQMRRLPGIGKYTAHAVASFAFSRSVPIVEANVARVLARLFNFRQSIDSAVGQKILWRYAASLFPKSGPPSFNSAILDLGALICVARRPKCNLCPVKAFCRAKEPAVLPVKKPRRQTKPLIENHAIIVRRGRILLEQSTHRWRGMWILPPIRVNHRRSGIRTRPIYQSVFAFTYHRVTLAVHRRPPPKQITSQQQWFVSTNHAAMPSPHRRALDALLRRKGDFSVHHE